MDDAAADGPNGEWVCVISAGTVDGATRKRGGKTRKDDEKKKKCRRRRKREDWEEECEKE